MVGGKLKEIRNRTQTAKELIQQGIEKRQNAIKLMAWTKALINDAKQLGINTTIADQILNNSEIQLKSAQENFC